MISISHVSKSYGSFQVLKECNAEVARGEVVVICGPSGSGKSTLIKTVNGLENIDAGEIKVGDFRLAPGVTHMAALRRSVGMVFQSFELFPHLTVLSNVTIAQIKVLKRPKAVAEEKARALLARIGEQVGGRAELDHLTEEHEAGVIGDPRRLLKVVRDDDDGEVAFQLHQRLFELCGGDRVERRRRFVEQKHLGLDGDAAGDA